MEEAEATWGTDPLHSDISSILKNNFKISPPTLSLHASQRKYFDLSAAGLWSTLGAQYDLVFYGGCCLQIFL